jgi:peptide/nickel transport system substrate-binding protein
VVGGYSNAQVALRRAIAMGFDVDNFIKVLFAGNALPANQLLPPGVNGHDPTVPPKSLYDPARARALLDRFGFKDVDGDGYRETPDGKPLTLVRGTLPESWYRDADTLWKKNMDAIGIRM